MDDVKLSQQASRGGRAAALLNDEAFNDAIAGVKDRLMSLWLVSKDDQHELRERLWLQVSLIDQIKQALIIAVRDGREANRQMDENAQLAKLGQSWTID